jgi:ribosomal protein S18 acetylase RimI-like enzyme
MKNFKISFMEMKDVEQAAKVLSIAMLDNPLHSAVFQNTSENTRILIENDFKKLLKDIPGIVFIAKENQDMVGVMRMNSCSGKNKKRQKVPKDENSIDWRKFVWLNEWDNQDPKDQHWHLGPIGVLPAYQGSGIGTTLMKRFCREVDACQTNAYLETDKEVNVQFYEKFGFKTISEAIIFGVKNRFMLRVPSGG